jgi:hypothetical protein
MEKEIEQQSWENNNLLKRQPNQRTGESTERSASLTSVRRECVGWLCSFHRCNNHSWNEIGQVVSRVAKFAKYKQEQQKDSKGNGLMY